MARKTERPRTGLTQSGVTFVVVIVLVQLASFTTGENLLYLLTAGVASLFILGAVLTRVTLRGLVIRRDVPEHVERGALFKSMVRIENRKRFFPTVSIQVSGGSVPEHAVRHVGRVPARDSLSLWLGHLLDRRGIHPLPPVRLRSGFPLGLFRTTLFLRDEVEVVVLPRVRRIRPQILEQLSGSGNLTRPDLGEGDEFFSLRDYVRGDDIRRISWKVSARAGRLIVRELEPSVARSIRICFDTRVPRGALDSGAGLPADLEDQFEEAVDLVASLAVACLDRQYRVSVSTPEMDVPAGEGSAHAGRVLRELAMVRPREWSGESWPGEPEDLSGAAVLLVSADPSMWGTRSGGLRTRYLNPAEVSHA